MKKTVRILALALVLVMMTAALVSCGKPNGKYVNGPLFFDFDGKEVTFSVAGLSATGTYEIKDGKIYLTYELPVVGEKTVNYSYEKDGNTLIIGGVEYTKEK